MVNLAQALGKGIDYTVGGCAVFAGCAVASAAATLSGVAHSVCQAVKGIFQALLLRKDGLKQSFGEVKKNLNSALYHLPASIPLVEADWIRSFNAQTMYGLPQYRASRLAARPFLWVSELGTQAGNYVSSFGKVESNPVPGVV